MGPVERAVWVIESRFGEPLSLGEVAEACGISRFHLSHAFAVATGATVMGYVRRRRLSEAARALSDQAPDILSVALDAGYNSHEAFTRAFRAEFGLTPEQLRATGSLQMLVLQEPFRMDTTRLVELAPPRLVEGAAFRIAGLSSRYHCDGNEGIPAQWQRFAPYLGALPGQIGGVSYGLCCNADGAGNFDYICGVELRDFSEVPSELTCLTVAAQRYAVFTHRGHISGIRNTVYTIFNQALPALGLRMAEAPDFERYDARFDAQTGQGEVEIWVPLA